MNILNNKAEEIVRNMIIANFPKIIVKSGKCRYNYRCQMNAVHDALNNNQDKLAMCFYIENHQCILHFINIDKHGNYKDNTLGRWSEMLDYYLIRIIEKDSFFSIEEIFSAYRKDLKNKLPLLVRLFSDVEF